ncbi:MAG: IS4 family transposase [Saprospiraceae bacterium]|nr:IS4 family transposase [Saprospiraceae bacterium]
MGRHSQEFGKPGFGPNANSETSLATCSLLYDVLNHITIDAQIGPYTESERSLLDKHFAKIERGDLLLADHGYPGYELMLNLLDKGVEFCFRMNENWWKAIKSFNNSTDEDALVEFELPKKVGEQYGKEILTVRLIKVKFKDGKSIVLGTSLLDRKKYPHDQFRALYRVRWDIEETYKLLKSRIEIEAFSGRTARSVRQDFHTKVFMMNLCATLSYPIEERVKKEYHQEKTGNKYSQKMNNTNAISLTKDNLI